MTGKKIDKVCPRMINKIYEQKKYGLKSELKHTLLTMNNEFFYFQTLFG